MKKENRLSLLEQPLIKKAADIYAERAKEFTKPRNEVYLVSSATAVPEGSSLIEKAVIAGINEKIREIALVNINGLLKKELKVKKFDLPEHIPNFSEFDDFLFQMLCISGLPLDRMGRLEREISEKRIDIKTLNNYRGNWAASKFEHGKLLDVFKGVLGIAEEPLNPVAVIVLLPDYPEDSLGGGMEIQLARYLNIPLKEVVFNSAHKDFQKKVVGKITEPQSMNELNFKNGKIGGVILPTMTGNKEQIVLVRNLNIGPIWRR